MKISIIVIFFLVTATCNTVTCSFTIDNRVQWAEYNGKTLPITSNDLNDWTQEKAVTFESCDQISPGTLTINGIDYETEGI